MSDKDFVWGGSKGIEGVIDARDLLESCTLTSSLSPPTTPAPHAAHNTVCARTHRKWARRASNTHMPKRNSTKGASGVPEICRV